MSQPRDDRQDDLFRPSLEKIISLRNPLVRLAAEKLPGGTLQFGLSPRPGQPPLPTRLIAGLFILKHMHNLSDEALCDRWVENPFGQTRARRTAPELSARGQARRRHGGAVHSPQFVCTWRGGCAMTRTDLADIAPTVALRRGCHPAGTGWLGP